MQQEDQHISEAKARTTFIRCEEDNQERHDQSEQETDMGTFDVCALEDVEGSRNDTSKSTTNTVTTLPASGLTPAIMMKHCEEIMTNLKASASQRSEAHEQSGSSSSGHQSNVVHVCTRWQRARRGPYATRVDGALWRSHQRTLQGQVHPNEQRGVHACHAYDQEREDVSTTASDGDVNPRWLEVSKKRSKKEALRTEAQETLDINAVHNIDEEKLTITIDSGAGVSVMPKDMLLNVTKSGGPEKQ